MKKFLTTVVAVFLGAALWNLVSNFAPIRLVQSATSSYDNNTSLVNFLCSFSPTNFLVNCATSKQTVMALDVSYMDMVSVLLTAVTIVVGALGLLIAVLAFVGWNAIRTIADASARKVVTESIEDGGKLHEVVRKETRAIIRYSGVETYDTEFDEDDEELSDENDT